MKQNISPDELAQEMQLLRHEIQQLRTALSEHKPSGRQYAMPPINPPSRPTPKSPTGEPPECPLCGAPTKLRKSYRGQFYGCSTFPECRGTVNLNEVPQSFDERVDNTPF